MKITLETIANATRQLALENKKAADDMDTELPEEVKAFFADDIGLDDDEVLNTEKDPEEDGKKAEDEPEAADKEEDEPKDAEPEDKAAEGDTAADALADLKDAALDDTDKDAEIADAPDLDDEDTVLDLSAGKKEDDEDKEPADECNKAKSDANLVSEGKRCKTVKVHVYDIDWDTSDEKHWDDDQPLDVDDEDDEEHWDDDQIDDSEPMQDDMNERAKELGLPSETDLEVEVCPGDDLNEVIGEALSDEYEYCVKGFNFDVVKDAPVSEDGEGKEKHTYTAYFDTSVPADVFAEGYSITTDQGDEYAVSVLSQVTENEAGDFPLENVTKDGEDWYDEFNEILDKLMSEDRVYFADYDDRDIEWIGMKDDDDEDEEEDDEEEEEDVDEGNKAKHDAILVGEADEDGTYLRVSCSWKGLPEDCEDAEECGLPNVVYLKVPENWDYDMDISGFIQGEWDGELDDINPQEIPFDEIPKDEIDGIIDMTAEDDEEIDESALGDAFKSIGQGIKGLLHSTLKGAAVLIAGLGGSFLFGLPGLLLAVCIAFGLMSAKESAKGVEVDEGLLGGVKDKLKTVLGVLKADPKKSKELNDKMLAAKKAGDKEAMKKIAGEVKALAGNGGKTPPEGGKKDDAVQVAESRYERNIVDARPQGDKVTLVLRCPQCGETKEIEVTSDEYDRLVDGDGHIQDILPDVSPDDREMFLSGFCSKCWDAMFGGPEEEEDDEVEVDERHGEFKRPKFKRDKWSDGPRRKPRFDDEEDDYADDYDEVDLTDDEVDAEDLGLVAERKKTPLDERIRDWARAYVDCIDRVLNEMDDNAANRGLRVTDDDYVEPATKLLTNAFKFLAGSGVEIDQQIIDDMVNGDFDKDAAVDLVAGYLGGHLEKVWLSIDDEDEFADAADQLLRGLFAIIHAPKDTKAANLRRNAKLIQTYIEVGGGAGVQVAEETPDRQPEDPTDGKPEENIPPEYEVAAEDICPDCDGPVVEGRGVNVALAVKRAFKGLPKDIQEIVTNWYEEEGSADDFDSTSDFVDHLKFDGDIYDMVDAATGPDRKRVAAAFTAIGYDMSWITEEDDDESAEVADECDMVKEDPCPDCGAQMREEPHTGNQRCPRCHHFEKGSYKPSIFEEEDGKVELSDITADDIKSIQGMDDKAKAELTKMDPEEREETLQLLGVADEGSVGEHVDFEIDDGEDDDEEFDAPAGCGRNPNKFKGSSPIRHRDHSDKFGSVKGPRDRRFKPRREVDIAAEHTKDVSTVSEVRKFLKECNTYSKSPALRRSVRKFDRLVKESPLKARAIVKSLDKRFSGKPVSEKRFCAAFIGSL